MLTASFTVIPTAGDVYGTEFFFTNTTNNILANKYVWNFGDGTQLYKVQSPTHIFNYPGTYNVSLTATSPNNQQSVATQSITVDYVLRDYIKFIQVPEAFADPGLKTEQPFKVEVVSSQINSPIILNLFAVNSNSIPYKAVNKRWAFLNPTWKFLDTNDTIVETLSVQTTPIYRNSKIVGVSGTAEFYYVDSTSTENFEDNCPVILTVTLETSGFSYPKDSNIYPYPSYANTKNVVAALPWQVRNISPTLLKVTGNYLDPIYTRQWENIKTPFLITYHGNRSQKIPGAKSVISEIVFTYPQTNETGNTYPVNVSYTNTLSGLYTVEESPLYPQISTNDGFRSGGYIYTTATSLTSLSSTSLIAQTTAYTAYPDINTDFSYIPPIGFGPNSFIWLSNPTEGVLNKVSITPFSPSCSSVNYYSNQKSLVPGFIKQISVPVLSTQTTFNNNISGFAGVLGLAIDPRNYELIACDAELDTIYKFTSEGTLISSIQLSSIGLFDSALEAYTPAYISLDRDYNIWVSLFNTVSTLKFDKDFNLLLSVAPSGFEDPLSVFDGDFLIKPPVVETDKNNNCWVTYAHPLCSMLVWYSSGGNIKQQIVLEDNSIPTSIVVTPNNNIWYTKSFNNSLTGGKIELYDTTTTTLVSSIVGYNQPTYISSDRDGNVWFVHDIRKIGCIERTGNTYSWTLETISTEDNNPNIITGGSVFLSAEPFSPREKEDEDFGGLGVDAYNRVWVLDSVYNKVYVFPAKVNVTSKDVLVFSAQPGPVKTFYPDPVTGQTRTEQGNYEYRSIQALGDWTGNRWYQKYINETNLTQLISGISDTFTVYPFTDTNQIRRVNETFNTAQYLQDLMLPERLKNNPNLFNNFFAGVVGDSTGNELDLGQVVYERIANFTSNFSDIDTCTIDQLISYAEQLGIPALNYGTQLPTEIKRLLDIGSIPRGRLWGTQTQTTDLNLTLGEQLTETSTVTAGAQLVLKSKFDSTLQLVPVPVFYVLDIDKRDVINTLNVYPVSGFNPAGFIEPVIVNYFVYNYKPSDNSEFTNNLIDWSNDKTTLSPYMSTFNEWYGDGGNLETAFQYMLTKNLFTK